MRLLLVELSRLRSRRAVVLILLGATLLAAIIVGTTVRDTRPVSAADLAQAQAQVDRDLERPRVQRDYQRCLEDPEEFMGPGATEAVCEEMLPQLEWYLYRPQLDLGEQVDQAGLAVLLLLAGVAIVVGATFAGADWATGSMSNQLLFEPRRAKVWLAKAAALAVALAMFSALVVGAFWAVLMVTAQARDIATPAAVSRDIWHTSGRGVVLAAGAGLGSFALTMLFRHTVGTLSLLLGYAVAGEAFAASLPIRKVTQWTLSANTQAWLRHDAEVFDETVCRGVQDGCEPTYVLTFGHAAWVLGLLLLVVMALSVLVFRRRDVP
jgi:hypothetical protein